MSHENLTKEKITLDYLLVRVDEMCKGYGLNSFN